MVKISDSRLIDLIEKEMQGMEEIIFDAERLPEIKRVVYIPIGTGRIKAMKVAFYIASKLQKDVIIFSRENKVLKDIADRLSTLFGVKYTFSMDVEEEGSLFVVARDAAKKLDFNMLLQV